MRTSLRVALVGIVAFFCLSLALSYTHRDDWRDHLRDLKNYRPHFRPTTPPSSIDKPTLGGGIGEKIHADEGISGASDPGERPSSSGGAHSEEDLYSSTPNKNKGPLNGDGSSKTPDKAIVMARLTTEDTSWVKELSDWSWYVYTVDDVTAPLHTPQNKGRESLAYLTYLVENYDALAHTIAFIHSHKDGYPGGWHTDAPSYSNVAALNMLQTPHIQNAGYANLRCNPSVGCPAEIQLHRDPPDDTRTTEIAMRDNWANLTHGLDLFPPTMPETIATPCCAQFAVSAAQVRRRPRADYVRFRDWVLETPLSDDLSGRVMEYFWHMVFGREPVFCPDMSTCYCDVYGRC